MIFVFFFLLSDLTFCDIWGISFIILNVDISTNKMVIVVFYNISYFSISLQLGTSTQKYKDFMSFKQHLI